MQRNAFVVVLALIALGVGTLVWRSGKSSEDVSSDTDGGAARSAAQGGLAARSGDLRGGGAAAVAGSAAGGAKTAGGAAAGAGTGSGGAGAGDNASSGAAAIRDRLAQARKVGATTGTGLPADGSIEVAEAMPGDDKARGVRPERPVQNGGTGSNTTLAAPEEIKEPAPEVAFDSGTDKKFVTETQVELPDVGKISGEAGTMAFWVKPDWQPGDQNDTMFLQMGDSGLHITKNVNFLRFEYFDNQGQEQGLGVNIGEWKPGEWHQVTGTWVGGQYQLFVDGKMVSQNLFKNPPDFQDETKVYAGSNFPTGSPAPGEMSQIKVLNRGMTAAEIAALYQSNERPR